MLDWLGGIVIGLVGPVVLARLLPNKFLFNLVFFQVLRLIDWGRGKFGAAIVKPIRTFIQESVRVVAMAIDEALGFYDRYTKDNTELMSDPYTYITNERKKINGKNGNKVSPNPGSPLSAYK